LADAQPTRVALVTGASRGIGAACAIELARRGVHVVATARTQGGLEAVDDAIRTLGGTATLLPLDLMEDAALDAIGPTLFQRFGRLDILVSNAASLGRLTPVPHILPKDWAEVIGVNVTATWRLIRTCERLLLASEAGRAVFVTSAATTRPTAYWGAYGATKAAMEHLALSWAGETRQTRLRINLFDPGVVATRLRAAAMPGENPDSLARPEDVAPDLADLCEPTETRHGDVVRRLQPPHSALAPFADEAAPRTVRA
jgi:NAD(P)-dependent dehydrogenase (short-subunit alcohol dehydrogenase family)